MTDTPTPAHRFELGQTYTRLNATWPLSEHALRFNTTVAGHARIMSMEIVPKSRGRECRRVSFLITYTRADGSTLSGGTFSRDIESFTLPFRGAEVVILNELGDGWWWSADMTPEESAVVEGFVNWREELAKPSPPAEPLGETF